jgi:hypothetical protein
MEIKIGNNKDFVWFSFPPALARDQAEAPYEWNLIFARISSGAWQGSKIQMNLTTNEILDFLRSLIVPLTQLVGSAELKSLEEWIELTLKINSLGKIEIRGSAKDSDIGNRLKFFIETDQSFFSQMPKNIQEYISAQKAE